MKQSKISLKSTTSFNKINRAITNTSISKQTHSFSKSPRFSLPRPICQEYCYTGPQTKSQNYGTSIGMGLKFDFTKDLTCSPGTGRYNIKSEIQSKVDKKKGTFMGLGREKMVYGSYINREQLQTPSPDNYKISSTNIIRSPQYTLRPKTKMINKTMSIQAQNTNPGPGDYKNPELNYQSRCGKFSNISYSYGVSKSHRFLTEKSGVPGPGSYNDVTNFSNVGRYVISTDRGGTGAKFDAGKRVTQFEDIGRKSQKVPGVGAYHMPSEFGYY